jgi:hypothetical protein
MKLVKLLHRDSGEANRPKADALAPWRRNDRCPAVPGEALE